MNHAESKNPILEGSDILFECGQCGKSLAIDCRGAGLNVRCPQCDSELEVPIPDGFDLAELDKAISDSVASGKEIRIPRLDSDAAAAASSDTAEQIDMLKAELESIRVQRQIVTHQNADMLKAIRIVNRQIDELRKALDDLGVMLNAQPGPESDETQKIF